MLLNTLYTMVFILVLQHERERERERENTLLPLLFMLLYLLLLFLWYFGIFPFHVFESVGDAISIKEGECNSAFLPQP